MVTSARVKAWLASRAVRGVMVMRAGGIVSVLTNFVRAILSEVPFDMAWIPGQSTKPDDAYTLILSFFMINLTPLID